MRVVAKGSEEQVDGGEGSEDGCVRFPYSGIEWNVEGRGGQRSISTI